MFVIKSSIIKICKTHFRTLQTVHNVHDKLYEELPVVSNDISVHQKRLRILPIVVYKCFMKTNPDLMWDLYTTKLVPHNLRSGEKL